MNTEQRELPSKYNSISLVEKEPLLPLNGHYELQQQPNALLRNLMKVKDWLKTNTVQAILYAFFIYGLYTLIQRPYGINTPHSNDAVMALYEQQVSRCVEKPSIPYEGASQFKIDQAIFPRLSIMQKIHGKVSKSILFVGGETKVLEDKDIDQVDVKIDLKFDSDNVQDAFWIEEVKDEEGESYSLIIHTNQDYDNSNACASLNIVIRVPDAAALKSLNLGLANNQVTIAQGLAFDEFHASLANGNIDFSDGISTGSGSISLANGNIDGVVNILKNNFIVSMANGNTKIAIKKITPDNEDGVTIKTSLANGHNNLELPSDFNSNFELKSIAGKRMISSTFPEKIHRKGSSWGSTKGYYGNNERTANNVIISTVRGKIHLNYV
ncbi:MAG: hypothetical protein EXX96DRAFT_29546 [Benjaminiella poitrasii]|nr:MAG: hypothetical protein EXX96DRAFT_29546 [Benjaminiella poitrasii]